MRKRVYFASIILTGAALINAYIYGWSESRTRSDIVMVASGLMASILIGFTFSRLSCKTYKAGCILWIFTISWSALVAALLENDQVTYYFNGVQRLSGGFGSPNTLGVVAAAGLVGIMGQTFPSVVSPEAGSQVFKVRYSWAAIVALTGAFLIFIIIKTYSRGAILMVAYGVLRVAPNIATILRDAVGKTRQRKFNQYICYLGIIGLTLCALIIDPHLLERVIGALVPLDLSISHRLYAIESGVRLIFAAPFFGIGSASSIVEQNNALFAPMFLPTGGAIATNDYLVIGAWLGMAGLCGLVLYIAIIVTEADDNCTPGGQTKSKQSMWGDEHSRYSPILVAKALLLAAFFNNVILSWPTGLIFWITIGFVGRSVWGAKTQCSK